MTTDILYEPEIKMHRPHAMLEEHFHCEGMNKTYRSDFDGNSERTVEGERQCGVFEYDDSCVKAFALLGEGDSATTVFSFHAKSTAKRFYRAIVARNQISAILNETQVICCSDYHFAIEQIDSNDLTQLHYSFGDM